MPIATAVPPDTSTFSDRLADAVRYFGFNPSGDVETFQLILGVFAALIAYFLIHRSQIAAASEGRKLERNRLLNELNHEYFGIMARRSVVKASASPEASYEPSQILELESVLVRGVVWSPVKLNDDAGNGYRTINQSRYMRISEAYWVDSITLHLVLLWTKRVSHGLRLGVLSADDVMEMWRNILPWAKNNRFSLMAAWFGSPPDAQPAPLPDLSLRNWGWFNRTWWRFKVSAGDGTGKLGTTVRSCLGLRAPLHAEPPPQWRGDIGALYHAIFVVVDGAIRHRRSDILGYANPSYDADNAPVGSEHTAFDKRLRESLLR